MTVPLIKTLQVARQFASRDVFVVTQEKPGPRPQPETRPFSTLPGEIISSGWNADGPSLTGQGHQTAGGGTGVSEQTQTLIFRLGVLYVSALPRPVFFANTALVRPAASRVVVAENGTEPPYANRHLAC